MELLGKQSGVTNKAQPAGTQAPKPNKIWSPASHTASSHDCMACICHAQGCLEAWKEVGTMDGGAGSDVVMVDHDCSFPPSFPAHCLEQQETIQSKLNKTTELQDLPLKSWILLNFSIVLETEFHSASTEQATRCRDQKLLEERKNRYRTNKVKFFYSCWHRFLCLH